MRQRERKKREARQRWLAAGRRCFGERGVAATTVNDLAAMAGLSRAGFFLYFESKQALRDALRREWLSRWAMMVSQEISRAPAPAVGRRTALARLLRDAAREPGLVRALRVCSAGLDDGDDASTRLWARLGGLLGGDDVAGSRQAFWVALLRESLARRTRGEPVAVDTLLAWVPDAVAED